MLKVLFLCMAASTSFAEPISLAAGQVATRIVTTREVQMLWLMNAALDHPDPKQISRPPAVESKAFAQTLRNVLLDLAITLEAESLKSAELSSGEMAAKDKQISRTLRDVPAWLELKITVAEFNDGLNRLLRAKKYVQYRRDAVVIPVSEGEMRRYYEENRSSYPNLPFEKAAENIKSSLTQVQVEKRAQEFFESLRRKYQVKLFIAEQ